MLVLLVLVGCSASIPLVGTAREGDVAHDDFALDGTDSGDADTADSADTDVDTAADTDMDTDADTAVEDTGGAPDLCASAWGDLTSDFAGYEGTFTADFRFGGAMTVYGDSGAICSATCDDGTFAITLFDVAHQELLDAAPPWIIAGGTWALHLDGTMPESGAVTCTVETSSGEWIAVLNVRE